MSATHSRARRKPFRAGPILLILVILAAIAYGVLVARFTLRVQRRRKQQAEDALRKQKLEEQAKRDAIMANARSQSYVSTGSSANKDHSLRTVDYFDEFFPD